MNDFHPSVALVGPGRAGTTIALALVAHGARVVAVAGRAPDAASTREAAACLDADPVLVSHAGRGADLVVLAVPDDAITEVAVALAPSLEPGALLVHLAGSQGIDVFAPVTASRPDVRVGALHPLQTFPSASAGLERLPGAWAAVAGDDEVARIAERIGLHPFPLADDARARYHAAASVASNHLVALLGQVDRLATTCGVPFAAFVPLIRASVDNALDLGPEAALTGPVARGDLATIAAHLAALDPTDRDAYRAMAREAARLAGRRDTAIDRLLDDLRHADPGTPR
ncbi:MAG TPA: DUF2520 domain-containing protein [Acidimicrobiia bacterium]|nr:DUF2520 domain-containing protein [Acidimicrobiia bacterium]